MLDQLYSLGLRVELVTLFWVRKEEGPLADPNVQEKLGSGAEGSDDEMEEGDGFDAGEEGVGVREREGTEAVRSPKRGQFSCCSRESRITHRMRITRGRPFARTAVDMARKV
jgi:hypothetical protein